MKYFIFIFCIVCVLHSSVSAQEQDTVISSDGKEITISAQNDLVIENPREDTTTLIMTPKEGVEIAKAQIKQDDDLTQIAGKKITYTPKDENFLIEGNAVIETETETLKGPKRIQFDPEKNFMIVEGTKQKWAEFRYVFPDGRVMQSYGLEFRFYFENVDGKRMLKRIEKV